MEKENKREVGTQYEQLAAEYLKSQGMDIIKMNYRVKIGEIDIIAKDEDCLVFVEVKYRKSRSQGGALYAISEAKKQKIRRVAQWFMAEKHLSYQRTLCRFDAVLIDGEEITHIRNAWGNP